MKNDRLIDDNAIIFEYMYFMPNGSIRYSAAHIQHPENEKTDVLGNIMPPSNLCQETNKIPSRAQIAAYNRIVKKLSN